MKGTKVLTLGTVDPSFHGLLTYACVDVHRIHVHVREQERRTQYRYAASYIAIYELLKNSEHMGWLHK